MKKIKLLFIVILAVAFACSACAPVKKPLDNRIGFTKHLKETESHIRQEDWVKAAESLKLAQKSWKKLKPLLQIDIDHDYVNDIENNITLLRGYIETKEKPSSLATILLLQEFWKQIGEM